MSKVRSTSEGRPDDLSHLGQPPPSAPDSYYGTEPPTGVASQSTAQQQYQKQQELDFYQEQQRYLAHQRYEQQPHSAPGSETPMFPSQQSSEALNEGSAFDRENSAVNYSNNGSFGTGPSGLELEETLQRLRVRCKKCLICEGVLSLALFFVFWAAYVVPFIVAVIGLTTSAIGVTHYGSHRDLHHNNCCCNAVQARTHLVHLHLALIIADAFGILCSIAAIASACYRGGNDFTYRLTGSIFCLLFSILLMVAVCRAYRLCKMIRLLTPAPQVAAVPVTPTTTVVQVPHSYQNHNGRSPATRHATTMYYAQPPQHPPVVVGTIVR